MNDERSLEEINAHRHGILEKPEDYRIVAIQCEQDLDAHSSRLSLRLRSKTTGDTCWLHFTNPTFNSDPFLPFFR